MEAQGVVADRLRATFHRDIGLQSTTTVINIIRTNGKHQQNQPPPPTIRRIIRHKKALPYRVLARVRT